MKSIDQQEPQRELGELLRIPSEWYVITGAPGTGKTTSLEHLAGALPDIHIVPEAAAALITRLKKHGFYPDTLPLYGSRLTEKIVRRMVHTEQTLPPQKPAILDRALGDVVAYARYYNDPTDTLKSLMKYEYKGVFILDRIGEVEEDGIRYEQDPEEFATAIDHLLEQSYIDAGYTPIRVPAFPFGEGLFYGTAKTRKEDSLDQRTKFMIHYMQPQEK